MKKKIISGLLWKYAEKCSVQGVQLIVLILMGRVLSASDYGVVGIITVFIAVANVFVQSGFGSALIQKMEVDEEDWASVFYVSMLISAACYVLMFLSSPLIAEFFMMPQLELLLRVQALVLLIAPINNIQNVMLLRRLQFRSIFFRNMGAILISGTVGILMVYADFGVWALVWSSITNSIAAAIILGITVKWRPVLKFSLVKVKKLFGFGWKLLLSSLLDTIYTNLYAIVIGKVYTADLLGYYSRGKMLPAYVIDNVDGAIQDVIFPTISSVQTDKALVRGIMSRSIKISTYLIFPAMAGLAAVAEPLTIILLTEKWLPSVPFMQLSCISYAFWSIHTTNLQTINALGRSDIFLRLEIIKKALGVAMICLTIQYGIYVLVAGSALLGVASTFINGFYSKNLIGYGIGEQWKDVLPALLIAIIMGIAVWSVLLLSLNVWLTLILQLIIGATLYIGFSWLFKLEPFRYLIIQIKNRHADNNQD